MPDLTLSFVNPRLLDDVSFHPCVRLKKWEVNFESIVKIRHDELVSITFLLRVNVFFRSYRPMVIFVSYLIILVHKSKKTDISRVIDARR
jgi:hypothetical protein